MSCQKWAICRLAMLAPRLFPAGDAAATKATPGREEQATTAGRSRPPMIRAQRGHVGVGAVHMHVRDGGPAHSPQGELDRIASHRHDRSARLGGDPHAVAPALALAATT